MCLHESLKLKSLFIERQWDVTWIVVCNPFKWATKTETVLKWKLVHKLLPSDRGLCHGKSVNFWVYSYINLCSWGMEQAIWQIICLATSDSEVVGKGEKGAAVKCNLWEETLYSSFKILSEKKFEFQALLGSACTWWSLIYVNHLYIVISYLFC